MCIADRKDPAIITSCIWHISRRRNHHKLHVAHQQEMQSSQAAFGTSAGQAANMICHHHLLRFVLCSLSSSSMCPFGMHNHPSPCAAGTWGSSGPLDQLLLLCWALPLPTSGILSAPLQTRTRCVRACVPACMCVHELSEAHGHATCPFSMLFAVHTTVCSIAMAASLLSAPA